MPAFKPKLTGLKPDEEQLVKLDDKDPAIRYKMEQNAKNKNLKAMNALKSVSPMLFWTMVENSENKLEFFKEISKKVNDLALKLIANLSLDADQFPWAKNQVERSLAEICGSLVAAKKEVNWEEMDKLLPEVADLMIKNFSEKEIYVSLDSSVSFKMALFHSLNKFYLEMASFAKHPEFHAEMQKALELSIELTNTLVEELSDKILGEKDRSELFKAGLNESVKAILFYWKLACQNGFVSSAVCKNNVANYVKKLTKTVIFLIKK